MNISLYMAGKPDPWFEETWSRPFAPYTREIPHDESWRNGEVVVYTRPGDPFCETASFQWGEGFLSVVEAKQAAQQFIKMFMSGHKKSLDTDAE